MPAWSKPPPHTVTPSGRNELTEALRHMSYAAQRQFPRVGNELLKTPWDRDHERIDELLTLLQLTEEKDGPALR